MKVKERSLMPYIHHLYYRRHVSSHMHSNRRLSSSVQVDRVVELARTGKAASSRDGRTENTPSVKDANTDFVSYICIYI